MNQISQHLNELHAFPRIGLGNWPTPLESIDIEGTEILIKRDDKCEYGMGGSKARKIESLVGYLKSRGYTELITVAGNISNVVYDLLPALKKHNIKQSLLIVDDPPSPLALRKKIFQDILGQVRFTNHNKSSSAQLIVKWYVQAKIRGEKPIIILPSLSHPASVIGNALGFIELMDQCDQRGYKPNIMFVSAASGSMYAGFLLAEHLLRETGSHPVEIVAVQVYPGSLQKWVIAMLRWTTHFLDLKVNIPPERIKIVPVEVDHGFARYSPSVLKLCQKVNTSQNFVIDPIFSGKSWMVLNKWLKRNNSHVLPVFWHCGYSRDWEIMPHLRLES